MDPRTEAGHVLLASLAVVTAAGPYLADWSDTHLFNARWPPHAKFHDAQWILLGLALAYGCAKRGRHHA